MRQALAGIGVLLLVLFLASCAQEARRTFTVQLTPQAEIPAPTLNGATPSGSATVSLNQSETVLTVTGNFQGLTGPATNAHIHGPADEDETALPVFPLMVTKAASGEVSGTWEDITPAQVQQLRDGLYYINIHTQANGPGEIRGQLR